jgi:MoaA/NifB/PqqE/SkfB family radical SAM enzyme
MLELRRRDVRFSVGCVALKEHFADFRWLREQLPDDVYFWLNAYKREPDYYAAEDLAFAEGIDPLFPFNNQVYDSRGEACRAGSSVFSVDGDGTMRRCHFVKAPIGNIYEPDWESRLTRRPCPAEHCRCHIGYVHMDKLGLYDVFGEGVLERVPQTWPCVEAKT